MAIVHETEKLPQVGDVVTEVRFVYKDEIVQIEFKSGASVSCYVITAEDKRMLNTFGFQESQSNA